VRIRGHNRKCRASYIRTHGHASVDHATRLETGNWRLETRRSKPSFGRLVRTPFLRCLSVVMAGLLTGCGEIFSSASAPLFVAPLSIGGVPIGDAIIDTGGGYELMLRESFGLRIVDRVEVLAFGGREVVDVTEAFRFEAGGVESTADAAIVGLSVCECNGLGFMFFRKANVVLGLDFAEGNARFLSEVPKGGTRVPFEAPPGHLGQFDSAFVLVDVSGGGVTHRVLGLLDTGTNGTVMRRGIIEAVADLTPNRVRVEIHHQGFGTASVNVGLFDTPGLPDIILGTDVMREWADEWYFAFAAVGGTVIAFPDGVESVAPVFSVAAR